MLRGSVIKSAAIFTGRWTELERNAVNIHIQYSSKITIIIQNARNGENQSMVLNHPKSKNGRFNKFLDGESQWKKSGSELIGYRDNRTRGKKSNI